MAILLKGRIGVLLADTPFASWQGHGAIPEFIRGTWPAGTKVKCVMESRFYDIGLTTNLKAENGYDARVAPNAVKWPGITAEEQAELDERAQMHALQVQHWENK